MVTPDHLCPWGIKGKDLLKRHGYEVEDHHLSTMDEDKQFKEEHKVDETPQVWIEDKYIGNYDELREYLGLGPDPKEGTTYQPVMALFAGLFTWIIAPIVLIATTIGAVSIIKAVFVEKRSLKCACVGGDSNVPLGFISLSENLGMMAMAIWMMTKAVT